MEESGFSLSSFVCKVHFGSWRFQSDLGGMKSPILGPGFGNGRRLIAQGVCRPFQKVRIRVLGSTPADRSQEGSAWKTGVRIRVLGSTPVDRSQEGSAW
ncbi:unnamed protein product, partial [Staurois parvus]